MPMTKNKVFTRVFTLEVWAPWASPMLPDR